MGTYQEALESRKTAARFLLPLIEFEFGFGGLDSPELTQSPIHAEQMRKVFEICRAHGWTTYGKIRQKGGNLHFRLSKKGFKEIHEIAGPFADRSNEEWTRLILERMGKKGGHRGGHKTEEKVFGVLEDRQKWLSVEELCLELRLLPSVVREALRKLNAEHGLQRKRVGKTIFWKLN